MASSKDLTTKFIVGYSDDRGELDLTRQIDSLTKQLGDLKQKYTVHMLTKDKELETLNKIINDFRGKINDK